MRPVGHTLVGAVLVVVGGFGVAGAILAGLVAWQAYQDERREPAPQAFDAGDEVQLAAGPGAAGLELVVYDSSDSAGGAELDPDAADGYGCRVLRSDGSVRSELRAATADPVSNAAGDFTPVASTGDYRPGDTLVCDGPRASAAGLAFALAPPSLPSGALAIAILAAFLSVAGVAFVAVGIAVLAAGRRRT